MPDPATFRDSTQIVVPCDALEGIREALESKFVVTVFSAEGSRCRIIGSPVEIKNVSQFLARHGVSLA